MSAFAATFTTSRPCLARRAQRGRLQIRAATAIPAEVRGPAIAAGRGHAGSGWALEDRGEGAGASGYAGAVVELTQTAPYHQRSRRS